MPLFAAVAAAGCVVPHVRIRGGPIVERDGFRGFTFLAVTSFAPPPHAVDRSIGVGAGGRIASQDGDVGEPTRLSLTWLLDVDGALTMWRGAVEESRPRLLRVTAGAAFGAGIERCKGARDECPTVDTLMAAGRVGVEVGQIERGGTPAWLGLFAGAGVEVAVLGRPADSTDEVVQLSPYLEVMFVNVRYP